MFLNNRDVPFEIYHYKAISKRRSLTSHENHKLLNLEKGYEGECLYDDVFNFIGHKNLYILRDLYLYINNSITQYDSIIIMNNRIVINEVKNLTGIYDYKNNSWYKENRQMESDPFIQLSRAKSNLISLKKNSMLDFHIDSNIIFTSDDFYFSSDNEYMSNQSVLRSNLKNYFRSFKYEEAGNDAKRIVKLIKSAITNKRILPKKVDISKLKLGLYCGQCSDFNLIKGRFQFKCMKCGSIESYETHLLRAMYDYKYMFPDEAMTRASILYLIDFKIKKSTVYYALKKHCNVVKKGNQTYYSLKYSNFEQHIQAARNNQRYKDKIIQS